MSDFGTAEPVEAVFELPEQMRHLLEEANSAYQNADRKAHERWLERMILITPTNNSNPYRSQA